MTALPPLPCAHEPRRVEKVIIAGFPMKYCACCGSVWGFWSFVVEVLPWVYIITYTGSYWRALPRWFRGPS